MHRAMPELVEERGDVVGAVLQPERRTGTHPAPVAAVVERDHPEVPARAGRSSGPSSGPPLRSTRAAARRRAHPPGHGARARTCARAPAGRRPAPARPTAAPCSLPPHSIRRLPPRDRAAPARVDPVTPPVAVPAGIDPQLLCNSGVYIRSMTKRRQCARRPTTGRPLTVAGPADRGSPARCGPRRQSGVLLVGQPEQLPCRRTRCPRRGRGADAPAQRRTGPADDVRRVLVLAGVRRRQRAEELAVPQLGSAWSVGLVGHGGGGDAGVLAAVEDVVAIEVCDVHAETRPSSSSAAATRPACVANRWIAAHPGHP